MAAVTPEKFQEMIESIARLMTANQSLSEQVTEMKKQNEREMKDDQEAFINSLLGDERAAKFKKEQENIRTHCLKFDRQDADAFADILEREALDTILKEQLPVTPPTPDAIPPPVTPPTPEAIPQPVTP